MASENHRLLDNTPVDAIRPKVGLSSCLAGERVRFDSGHKKHSYITDTLGKFFDYHLFCPEVSIGLGIPREPIRLIATKSPDEFRCVGVKNPEKDVTDALQQIARDQFDWVQHLSGYIVKKDSPSCGMERVKVFHGKGKNQMPMKEGIGLYTQQILKAFPQLPVEEEGRLGDPILRENFIERVYVYARWKALEATGLTPHKLIDFHTKHKFTLLSHDQKSYRTLGRLVSGVNKDTVNEVAKAYIEALMASLRIRATKGNHINVLQHLLGFVSDKLTKDEKAELLELFDSYRKGEVPRIVPLTLINHFFRKYPNDYIAHCYYLKPYPGEMRLLNFT